jgi:hypothetical protein
VPLERSPEGTVTSLVDLGVGLAVMLGVLLGRLVGVMRGMQAMGMRNVGVMTGLFMLAVIIVLGCFAVMVGRALMMLHGGSSWSLGPSCCWRSVVRG